MYWCPELDLRFSKLVGFLQLNYASISINAKIPKGGGVSILDKEVVNMQECTCSSLFKNHIKMRLGFYNTKLLA